MSKFRWSIRKEPRWRNIAARPHAVLLHMRDYEVLGTLGTDLDVRLFRVRAQPYFPDAPHAESEVVFQFQLVRHCTQFAHPDVVQALGTLGDCWLVRESGSNPRPSTFARPNSPCVWIQPLKARTVESCSGRSTTSPQATATGRSRTPLAQAAAPTLSRCRNGLPSEQSSRERASANARRAWSCEGHAGVGAGGRAAWWDHCNTIGRGFPLLDGIMYMIWYIVEFCSLASLWLCRAPVASLHACISLYTSCSSGS